MLDFDIARANVGAQAHGPTPRSSARGRRHVFGGAGMGVLDVSRGNDAQLMTDALSTHAPAPRLALPVPGLALPEVPA